MKSSAGAFGDRKMNRGARELQQPDSNYHASKCAGERSVTPLAVPASPFRFSSRNPKGPYTDSSYMTTGKPEAPLRAICMSAEEHGTHSEPTSASTKLIRRGTSLSCEPDHVGSPSEATSQDESFAGSSNLWMAS
ncbi:unnamed protein product [Arctogadus glacialis]